MRRAATAFLCALWLASLARAGSLDDLLQDAAKKKEIEKGMKALDRYFAAEFELRKGSRKAGLANAQATAQGEFLAWLDSTPTAVGTDLRAETGIVIDMLDRARSKYLETRFKRGSIEYVKVGDAAGMKRLEYSILVPKGYDPSRKIPVVVSLHGRVINPRHPAFRGAPFDERARQAIWNNWFRTKAAEEVLVVAPTTTPDGFLFAENYGDDLQAAYRTLGEALTNYRTDWERVFLEVHGRALRVACDQALMFAGFLVRERVDDRRAPILPPEEFFLLENLNGVPLVYVADEANWDKVGKPLAAALAAAYEKAGKAQNLVVIRAERDVDGALRGGEDAILEFVRTHRRPRVRESFTWRFFQQTQEVPLPLELTRMNFNFDVSPEAKKAPLSAKAGRIAFEAKRAKDGEGRDVSVIELKVTEAEGARLHLYEPLVNFDLPLTVTVNGKPTDVTAKKLERDWGIFFNEMLPRRFFMLPILGRVEFSFEGVPEFAPPAPPEQPGAAEPAEGSPAGVAPAAGQDGSGPGGGSASTGGQGQGSPADEQGQGGRPG